MSRSRSLPSLLMGVVVAGAALTGPGCKKDEQPSVAPGGAAPPAAPATKAAGAPAGVLGNGTISGTVKFAGKPPEPRPINTPDSFCSRQKLVDEDLVVGAAGGLKNAVVRLVKGVSGSYPPPAQAVVVDQSGCTYRPRVQAAVAGQKVEIRNSDQTMHNVHTFNGARTVFNQVQMSGSSPLVKTFSDGGQIVRFRCDIHSWMIGYLAISSHPFFAVTDDSGAFKIEKVPPGTYTLEVWHERLGGDHNSEVTVADDKPATGLAIELKAP